MQAINIGYSPKHAAPPPVARPGKSGSLRRRLRVLVLAVLAFVLLAAGAGVTILRTADRHQSACHTAVVCARHGSSGGLPVRVLIDSAASFGLKAPAAIAVCRGHLWVTNQVNDSVTEFGWQVGSTPVIWSGKSYQLAAPNAITGGHDRLWVANTTSITEINAANGRAIRVISLQARVGSPRALVLYGRRLWVAGSASVADFSTATGTLIAVFGARRYGFSGPGAAAVSNGRLWVANAGDGSVTEMDAVTGRLVGRLPGSVLGVGAPAAAVADASTLWVANSGGNSVTEIDARTGTPIGQLSGARYGFASPTGIAVYRGRVWVVNHASGSVTELIPRSLH